MPAPLGRDAYRIVQEALTNVAQTRPWRRGHSVRVSGAPGDGLRISVRNRQPVPAAARSTLPGSGAGCSGCANGSRWRGHLGASAPTVSGDFVVEAELTWRT